MTSHRIFYSTFELLERNGQRVFGPANSSVWRQINARAVGPDNVLLGMVIFEDESFATQGVEPLNGIFAVMISNMFAILFIL